jgi:uncharacterized membrane protein
MQTVAETIEVALPVRTVYEQWSRFEFFPQFMSGVESLTRVSDRITHWVTNIGGVQREFDAETVDDRPDERISWRSSDGVSHAGAVSFTQLDPGNHTDRGSTGMVFWKSERENRGSFGVRPHAGQGRPTQVQGIHRNPRLWHRRLSPS